MSAIEQTSGFPGVAPSLRNRMVYFAHPIDLNTLGESQRYRMFALMRRVHEAGAVLYDPAGAFSVPGGATPHRAVAQVNRAALLAADCVVACFPESTGIGVSMEIQLADTIGCPSAILTDAGSVSWSLAGLQSAFLFHDPGHPELVTWMAEEAAEYAADRGSSPAPQATPLWVQRGPNGLLPQRSHQDDAAFDLFVSEETKIAVGAIVDVPCDVSIQLPEGVFGLILGRSSTSRTHQLLCHPGVIDTGYRGGLWVQVENVGQETFVAQPGMRLGQLIPLPNLAGGMVPVETVALQGSDRGPAGFGSTGI